MAHRYPYLCKENTSNTGARAPGGPHYVLLGASDDDHLAFGDNCSDGQDFVVMVRGPGPSPKWEVSEATYISSTNSIRPDVVRASSNGGGAVVWTGGTQIIYPILLDDAVRGLVDPDAFVLQPGLLTRNAQYGVVGRSIALGTLLNAAATITHPAGQGGNPTLELNYNLLARDAAAPAAARTMKGRLLLDNFFTQFLDATHTILGADGTNALKFVQNGATDYLAQLGVGGADKRILTIADFPVIWDWDHKFSTATAADVSGLENDTELTLATPDTADSGESYINLLFGVVQAHTIAAISSSTHEQIVRAQIHEAGASVAEGRGSTKLGGALTITAENYHSIPVFYHRAATPGTSYTYNLSAILNDGTQNGALSASGLLKHWLIGACLRLT